MRAYALHQTNSEVGCAEFRAVGLSDAQSAQCSTRLVVVVDELYLLHFNHPTGELIGEWSVLSPKRVTRQQEWVGTQSCAKNGRRRHGGGAQFANKYNDIGTNEKIGDREIKTSIEKSPKMER